MTESRRGRPSGRPWAGLKARPYRAAVMCVGLVGYAWADPSTGTATGPAMAAAEEMVRTFKAYHNEKDTMTVWTAELRAENEKVKSRLEAILDVPAMGKAALTNLWSTLPAPQRVRYTDLLSGLVRKIAYPNARKFFDSFQVTFGAEERKPDGRVLAKTTITPLKKKDVDVEVHYLMAESGGRWRVVDVVTDGESLVLDYRNQFQKIIREKTFGGLIGKMEKRLAD